MKLQEEWPVILRWMIDGCLDWQANGLIKPDGVLSATKDYFDDQDLFGHWLKDACDVGPNEADTHAGLFTSWQHFARDNGEEPGSSKSFTATMRKRHFLPVKNTPGHHGKRGFSGVSVKAIDTSDQWQNQKED